MRAFFKVILKLIFPGFDDGTIHHNSKKAAWLSSHEIGSGQLTSLAKSSVFLSIILIFSLLVVEIARGGRIQKLFSEFVSDDSLEKSNPYASI